MPSWFDRFTQAVWASSGTINDPTLAQANSGFSFLGQAPPTVELFNSLEQWSDNKDNWLYSQLAAVMLDAGITPTYNNLNSLLLALQAKRRIYLKAGITIYVDIAGNDSTGDGTSAKPFATLQYAYYYAVGNFDLAGQAITIQLKTSGTYAQVKIDNAIQGNIIINGDVANPRNYIIKGNTGGTGINAGGAICANGPGAGCIVRGISVESVDGYGMLATFGAFIFFQQCAFGPCFLSQIMATSFSQIIIAGTTRNYSIYGGAPNHINATGSAIVTISQTSSPIVVTNTPAFSSSFANASVCSVIQGQGTTFTGAATGVKATVDANAVHSLSGINPNTVYPGSSNATSTNGGQYV